ncbi:hypothetical protein Tco_0325693, partial [Tanacetum coccineum]
SAAPIMSHAAIRKLVADSVAAALEAQATTMITSILQFMNYLEEQTDGEAMINSIQNGDHPLP